MLLLKTTTSIALAGLALMCLIPPAQAARLEHHAQPAPAPPKGTVAAPAADGPQGIYLYDEQMDPPPPGDHYADALSTPGIDGMAVVLDWSTVESKADTFDFTSLQSQLDLDTPHLPIELVIRAGTRTPDWLKNAVHFAYSAHKGYGPCQSVVMPPPWDDGYQAAFTKLLQKTAEYLGKTDAKVAVVKLTGINTTTEELRLPADSTQCPGGVVDNVQLWRDAKYTTGALEGAFDRLAGDFAEYFPGVPITLPIIPRGAFPPLNSDGFPASSPKQGGEFVNALMTTLIGDAAKALQGRFILQFDFLINNDQANQMVMNFAGNKLPVAWQTNLWRQKDKQAAGCNASEIDKAQECSDADYMALLETGIHPQGGSGPNKTARYIEVFPYDVLAHKADIAEGHAELTQGSPPPVKKAPGVPKAPRVPKLPVCASTPKCRPL